MPDDDEELTVTLTRRYWRALAAVLYVSSGITTELTHRKIIEHLYHEVSQQTGTAIKPYIEEGD